MVMETGISDSITNAIIIFCVVLLVVFGGIEAIVLVSSYVTADKVSCNWLWCEFTTERGTANITISRECRVNGVITDCSDADNLTRIMTGLGYKASGE
jgi:hypothetical protein